MCDVHAREATEQVGVGEGSLRVLNMGPGGEGCGATLDTCQYTSGYVYLGLLLWL